MKKGLFTLIFLFLCNLFTFGQSLDLRDFQIPSSSSFNGVLVLLVLLALLGFIAIIIFIEIKIGKAVGSRLTKETGLILGIILIVVGITLFIGIPIIIYSNKKKEDLVFPTATIKINKTESETGQKSINYEKFVGKNYKDILIENNLEEYINIFAENKLTEMGIITDLTDSDLEKIGVTALGDRKKILKIFSL